MKALAVFPSSREVRLVEQAEPAIETPTEVKLRMLEVGVCGTDREIASFLYGEPPAGSRHLIIGHESLAEVVEVGSAVTALVPGDLCVVMVRRPCPHAHCRPCRSGRQDFCITGDFSERGIKHAHGFMTGVVVEDQRFLVSVPRELRPVAVLAEPLSVAEKAAEQATIVLQRLPGALAADRGNFNAVVLGAGPIGLLGAMKLVAGGFRTWVYSRGGADSPGGAVADAFGARFVSADRHSAAELAEMVGNISLVYEATGVARVAFEVMSVLGSNGIFIFTGVPGRKAPIELDADLIMRRLVLNNQVFFGTVNAGRGAYEAAVRDLETFTQRFPAAVQALITRRVPLADSRETVLSPPSGIKSVITLA